MQMNTVVASAAKDNISGKEATDVGKSSVKTNSNERPSKDNFCGGESKAKMCVCERERRFGKAIQQCEATAAASNRTARKSIQTQTWTKGHQNSLLFQRQSHSPTHLPPGMLQEGSWEATDSQEDEVGRQVPLG